MDISVKIKDSDIIEEMVKEKTTRELLLFISSLVDDKKWYDGNFAEAVINRIQEDHF